MNKRVGIIFPNKSSSSETFIKAHVDHLPCEKEILYGGWFPKFSKGDILLVEPITFFERVKRKFTKLFLKRSDKIQSAFSRREGALLNYIKENKLDAILAEYGPTGVEIMDVCNRANIPLVVHFHGFDAYDSETLIKYGELYKKLFEKAKAIIAVSKDMEGQLISLGASPAKVRYNVYGVDVNKFVPRAMPINEPIFFFVGRFVNKKAPHLLILAFSKVKEIISNARLIMGGDGGTGGFGELYLACKELVFVLNLTEAVEFKGALTPEEVVIEMQNAYAYVQHSVRPESGDSEGTPNSILEAGAAGLPVVATKHAGIKDVVIDGETGYLVDEYDVDGMAKRMIELATNPALAHKMGQAGRKKIVADFTMSRSISKLWDIIENTITEK